MSTETSHKKAPLIDSDHDTVESLRQEAKILKNAANAATDALAESKSRCAAYFDMCADGIVECALDGSIIDVNPAFCSMLGYSKEWLMGKNYRDITHPDSLELEQAAVQKAIRANLDYAHYEKSYIKENGEELPISITAWAVRDRNSRVTSHLALIRDISNVRKREMTLRETMDLVEREVQKRTAELTQANQRLSLEIMRRQATHEAWESSEARYQALVESIDDIVFSSDIRGRITFSNPAVEAVIGYTPEQVIGENLFDFVVDQDRERAMDQFSKAFVHAPQTGEFQVLGKSGMNVWLHVTATPWFGDSGIGGMRLVASDVSQNRLHKKEMLYAERLAAAGQFAFFWAQEISRLNGEFSTLPAALENRAQEDPVLARSASLLSGAFRSLQSVVAKLNEAGAAKAESNQAVNTNQAIEDILTIFTDRLSRDKISLNLHFSSRIPYTMAGLNRLKHVFFNLILHACDSIQAAGGSGNPIPGEINVTTRRKKDSIVIQVSDNGTGLSREDCQHMFDPGYSGATCAATRVGLRISRAIIQDHGGSIRVDRSPEGGAQFTVTLPVRHPGA